MVVLPRKESNMRVYMREHIGSLRKKLEYAHSKRNWKMCIEIEGRIIEAEYLFTAMLRRNLLND